MAVVPEHIPLSSMGAAGGEVLLKFKPDPKLGGLTRLQREFPALNLKFVRMVGPQQNFEIAVSTSDVATAARILSGHPILLSVTVLSTSTTVIPPPQVKKTLAPRVTAPREPAPAIPAVTTALPSVVKAGTTPDGKVADEEASPLFFIIAAILGAGAIALFVLKK